jgi:hypothetical protein
MGSIALAARCGAMEPDFKESLREKREGHGAVMLVGVLVTLLLAAAVIIASELAPVFRATAPPETAVRPDAPIP